MGDSTAVLPPADTLTFLQAPHVIGAKTFTPAAVIDFDIGYGPFHVLRLPILSPGQLAEVLAACPRNAFLVLGEPVEPNAATIPYRAVKPKPDRPPTLKRVAHTILPVDFDGTDLSVNGADLAAAAHHARANMPPAFRTAGALVQASSSAGIKPGARVRLWFWLERPISGLEAKAWLEGIPGVDLSIYSGAQPIYVAPPAFQGVADPYYQRSRWGALEGGMVPTPAPGILRGRPESEYLSAPLHVPLSPPTPTEQAYADGMLLAWEHECNTRDTHPKKPQREWYNGQVFALGSRAHQMSCGADELRRRVTAGATRWKARQPFQYPNERDENDLTELLRRVHEALADGMSQPYRPDQAPELKPLPDTKTAEKVLRAQAKRVAEDPALAQDAAARLAPYVAAGALSATQVGTAIAKTSDAEAATAVRDAKRAAKRVPHNPDSLNAELAALAPAVACGALSAELVGGLFAEAFRTAAIAGGPSAAEIAARMQAHVAAVPARPTAAGVAALVEQAAAVLDPLAAAAGLTTQAAPAIAARMIASEDGQPIPCPENMRVLLNETPLFRTWFDTRAQQDFWTVCPWREAGPVVPQDDTSLRYWISKQLNWHKAPVEPLAAIAEAAMHTPYDPWKAWLETLKWDGFRRLGRAAPILLGCDNTPVNKLMFAWWMISAVARTFKPGCQVDHVPVLEGAQGSGKTTFLRELAMDPRFFTRFTATSGEMGSPRSIGKISGPVFVELAELAALRKKEWEAIKAFIDERTDRVQWLYSKKPVNVPRTCVFVGTTNAEEYLSDPTGARRFWPIRCGKIVTPAQLHTVREQLWAEAVHLFLRGVRWYPTAKQSERLGFTQAQEERHEDAPMVEPLALLLDQERRKPGVSPLTGEVWAPDQLTIDGRIAMITATQACKLMNLDPTRDSKLAAGALRRIGWIAMPRKRVGSDRIRWWKHPHLNAATENAAEVRKSLN